MTLSDLSILKHASASGRKDRGSGIERCGKTGIIFMSGSTFLAEG